MTKLPTFPSIDFSNFDLSKIDLSKIDLSKLDLSKIDVPGVDGEKLAAALRDATYVTIGFGVLAFQQAQVRRRELVTSLSERFGTTSSQMDELLASFEARLDTAVEKLGARLPEQAGSLLGQAHGAAKAARKQMVGFLRAAA
jgi:hypothetical protein